MRLLWKEPQWNSTIRDDTVWLKLVLVMLPLQQLQLVIKALHKSHQLFPSFISLVRTDEQGQNGI